MRIVNVFNVSAYDGVNTSICANSLPTLNVTLLLSVIVEGGSIVTLLSNVIVSFSAVCSPSFMSTRVADGCVSFVFTIVSHGRSAHPHAGISAPDSPT